MIEEDNGEIVSIRSRNNSTELIIPNTAESLNNNDEDNSIFKREIIGFSIGHFYNDLCACMWFTYLMVFLEKVQRFESSKAGFIMLVGQVGDSLSTILVGYLSDAGYIPSFLKRFGKRISWHIIGTVAVALSFSFIFSGCWFCQNSANSGFGATIYLLALILLFQFGWAAVQISHLSLVPEMSSCHSVRNSMQSFRYAFSMIANVLVFCLLYTLFSRDKSPEVIDEGDLSNFSLAGLILTAIGLVASLIFYVLTQPFWKRSSDSQMLLQVQNNIVHERKMTWQSWLKEPQFYLVSCMYMLARLNVNVSQVYFPFYIMMTMKLEKTYVAVLPLIIYVSSFLCSLFIGIPWISTKLNRKSSLAFGISISLIISFMFYLSHKNLIFIIVVFMGIAQSVLLVSSVSLTSDLINKDTESGAFVFGTMSFFDKVFNGFAYQLIEIFNPNCNAKDANINCSDFYKSILIYLPGVCAFLMLLLLLILLPQTIGKRKENEDETNALIAPDDAN